MEFFRKSLVDQMLIMGLPKCLHEVALKKILDQTFDAGSVFQFQEFNNEVNEVCIESNTDVESYIEERLSCIYELVAIKECEMHSDVLLIDHMW